MKATTDKVIVTVVAVITAVFALVFIWLFLSKTTPYMTNGITKVLCNLCYSVVIDPMKGICDGICG